MLTSYPPSALGVLEYFQYTFAVRGFPNESLLQVMGMMLGKVDGSTMIVMDVFALPVEGTETRVNAQSQAYEYMSTYVNAAKEVRGCCG